MTQVALLVGVQIKQTAHAGYQHDTLLSLDVSPIVGSSRKRLSNNFASAVHHTTITIVTRNRVHANRHQRIALGNILQPSRKLWAVIYILVVLSSSFLNSVWGFPYRMLQTETFVQDATFDSPYTVAKRNASCSL